MKPGIMSTEFWTTQVVNALCVYLVVTCKVPSEWGLSVMGIAQGSVEVDGRTIYEATDLRVGLFHSTADF